MEPMERNMAKTIAQILAERQSNPPAVTPSMDTPPAQVVIDGQGNVVKDTAGVTTTTTVNSDDAVGSGGTSEQSPVTTPENTPQVADVASNTGNTTAFNKQPKPTIGADPVAGNTGMPGNNTNAPEVQNGDIDPYAGMDLAAIKDYATRAVDLVEKWRIAYNQLKDEMARAQQQLAEVITQRDGAMRRAEVMEAGGRSRPVTVTIDGDNVEIVRQGRQLHGTVGAQTDHVPTTDELNAGSVQTPRVS